MALTEQQRTEIQKKYFGTPKQSGTGDADLDRWKATAEASKKNKAATTTTTLPEEKPGLIDRAKSFAKGFGKGIVETEKTTGELVQGVGAKIPEELKKAASAIMSLFPGAKVTGDALSTVGKIPDVVSGAEEKFGLEQGELTTPQNKAEKVGFVTEKVGEFLVPTGAGAKVTKTALEARAAANLENRLVGALTKKEIRRALDEGRVIQRTGIAKRLGLADNITPEKKVSEAAETLRRRIANVAQLSDQEIATQSKKEIETISKELSPKLKTVDVPEEVKTNMFDSYVTKKVEQLDTADQLGITSQTASLQKRFERTLLDVIDSKNADDVWKKVQDFDSSVAKTIKEANSQSAESVQELKNVWLDLRRILRDGLDESVNIADDTVKQEFKEMTDLYTARQNIINAARFEKGRSSFGKQLLTGTIGTTLGGTVVGRLLID